MILQPSKVTVANKYEALAEKEETETTQKPTNNPSQPKMKPVSVTDGQENGKTKNRTQGKKPTLPEISSIAPIIIRDRKNWLQYGHFSRGGNRETLL